MKIASKWQWPGTFNEPKGVIRHELDASTEKDLSL